MVFAQRERRHSKASFLSFTSPVSCDPMTRLVREIIRHPERSEDVTPQPFSMFSERASIILLGDPGAGKTYLFREAAETEQAKYLTARSFLNIPADDLRGEVLFIDGLDEKRSGRSDQGTIDEFVKKLFEVNPPKVRISCRAGDWLGETDLAAFAPFFEKRGATCLLHLEDLPHNEQIAVLVSLGADRAGAERFLVEAVDRGLDDLLTNPQNLRMLWEAVHAGSWPTTRTNLFELSAKLMLSEFNQARGRFGVGTFTSDELQLVAGAICAARLISDVAGISLSDLEGTPDLPSYRSITLHSTEKVQAALSRRLFSTVGSEAVDYVHRTIAEYLGAKFLAEQVRRGLPLGRVLALLGVDGRPASELRGLHAWLAVHLPEHASDLIESDPYGVLTYADAASLTTSSCLALICALDRLSKINPWFRSNSWNIRSVGALARQDMTAEFRALLNDPAADAGLRSLVMDAVVLGTPLPDLLPDFQRIAVASATPLHDRLQAAHALSRLGEPGKTALGAVYGRLADIPDDLRIRSEILQTAYGKPYGVGDVIDLVQAMLKVEKPSGSNSLWYLADSIPDCDLPAILDGVEPPADTQNATVQRNWDAASFYARLLVRAWRDVKAIEPSRILGWLETRLLLKEAAGGSRARDLRKAMQATPEVMQAITQHFISSLPDDNTRWFLIRRFQETILFEVGVAELIRQIIQAFDVATPGTSRQQCLYEVALTLTLQLNESDIAPVFEELYEKATSEPILIATRDEMLVASLPEKFFEYRSRRAENSIDSRSRDRKDFDENIRKIRNGIHLGWMKHLSHIYFSLFSDTDRSISAPKRIVDWLGEERYEAAIEGFLSVLSRTDLPTSQTILALLVDQKYQPWWYAIVAGLNEFWARRGTLPDLPDDVLAGMLIFDITHSISELDGNTQRWLIHPWRTALWDQKPELARDAYLDVARLQLSQGRLHVDGLQEFLKEPAFGPYRSDIVLGLLTDFPNADQFRLQDLFEQVLSTAELHDEFLRLAEGVLSGKVAVSPRQWDLWLAMAYKLSPPQYESVVSERVGTGKEFLFDLRDVAGFSRYGQPKEALPLSMAEFLARLSGSLFPETSYPKGGWSGDTNPWDGSEFFHGLVNSISARPSSDATDVLERLRDDPQLASYKAFLLHARENQLQRRLEDEYDRPNWTQTICALDNKAPATASDLHALLISHFRDLALRVARANTDQFKTFWNVDSHGRPKTPKPEELCRDSIVDLLRPVLIPLGVTVEPEAHMVADKRADISAAMPGRKILCELKRDYHADVWTAVLGQLERFYAFDPEAKGLGVYVVLWFGTSRPYPIPKPPGDLKRPETAAEMETMLQQLIPEEKRKRLRVVVIDVSGKV